ncbi:MAG: acyl carrier protein [Clostridia bacterium]|nr:acyl carrier protein [Clostridia bacterium]MBQ9408000.1 acyl carrier protein [Clostridia bacterium]
MDYNTVFDKVSDLIVAQLPITKEQIKPESKLIDDLGADSANIMILICDIENEFDVQVDNDMLATVSTVDDIVKYLAK